MRRFFLFAIMCSLLLALFPAPTGATAQAASPDVTSAATTPYDFGEHQVATTTTVTFSVISGNSNTYITGVMISGANPADFVATNRDCPAASPGLAVGQSCQIDVSFTPKARGTRNATMVISCTSPNCPLTRALTGTGTGPCGLTFGDVKGNNPACEAIEGLAARGVIKGCDQTASPPLFCPNDPTLRAQMAALIARAVGWDAEDHNNAFPDRCLPNSGGCIDDALWRNIGTLQFYGVAKGYQDGTYNPFDNVLYAQTISFITRAMVKKGTWIQATVDDGTVYPNIPASSGHRLDFVTYTQYVGPVPGTTTKTENFDQWNQPSTRAWFALALWQALPTFR